METMLYDPSSSLTAGLLMSFQQGGGLGRRRGSAGWGWGGYGGGGGGVAPDAHTPTPTNYHWVPGNQEEVKAEAEADESVCPFGSQRGSEQTGRQVQVNDVLPLSQQPRPSLPASGAPSQRHLVLVWAQLYQVR